jgi:hypothetical protein
VARRELEPPEELEPPPPPPPELELEPPPPPPPDELLDDELREDDEDDDDVPLDEDELEPVLLLLELELDDVPLDSWDDDVLEPLEPLSGPVGDVPHPTPNMPTPARATPPDSMRRNCRRSSLRVASSTGCGFSDWLMRPPMAPP